MTGALDNSRWSSDLGMHITMKGVATREALSVPGLHNNRTLMRGSLGQGSRGTSFDIIPGIPLSGAGG